MEKGIIIGKSMLYDYPDKDFYLVYCQECDKLINVGLSEMDEEILCLCGKRIKISLPKDENKK